MDGEVNIEAYGRTAAGPEHKHNEDRFLVAELSKSILVHQTSLQLEDHSRLWSGVQGKLLIVADGASRRAASSDTSNVALRAVLQHTLHLLPCFWGLDEQHESELLTALQTTLRRAEAAVVATAAGPRRDMGTTMTMAYVVWPNLYVVHAGNSRCYLQRHGELRQITRDHTFAQRMVEEGTLSPDQAEQSEFSEVLVNALTGDSAEQVRPEVRRVELAHGDQVLLCTDGLTSTLPDDTIAQLLASAENVHTACAQLVEWADATGRADDVTVVVAEFERPGWRAAPAS